ncbi:MULTISPECIES: PepSY domain-containing protein [unclassified Methylobacterium]|uniref:PepSY domain-containing protein n=1 Tax=unclassified Methylobacterium TaxID=2615210 RepID=UPI0011C1FDD1|nr:MULTISPECIES: PepSY domain-containing protein [unclassified Methylobacterium]QEE39545.1 PepSY domain-containing protein [Methylobacterium sp. WL1]TXN57821.1 PepSY domain-containing protein [Methylobacterium sp. WL2]
MRQRVGKAARRGLLLFHRWAGIATALFFAMWIGSGLVMLYVPFPALTAAERLARLAPIVWETVAVPPDAALAAGDLAGVPAAFALEMRGDEPVYRITGRDGGRATVSGRTGARLGPVGAEAALRLAAGDRPDARVDPVERDQWTVTARYDPLRPFHKVVFDDPEGTELYVSAVTGEIALDTTRFERAWNWLGSVPHWIYLTPLRARAELWRTVLLWLSGFAALGAVSGLVVGIWRLRLRRRYAHGAVTPYRGLARWHHLFGLAGGLGLGAFILSGWISMNPNSWFASSAPPTALRSAYAGTPGPLGLDVGRLRDLAGPDTRSLRFTTVGGRWWVVAEAADGPRAVAPDGGPGPDATALAAAAADAIPMGHLRAAGLLGAYDAYWYPHGVDPRPLPVLRLRFDDPDATWLHIDPRDGTILQRLDRSGRINRWLFDAPHRLDFPFLSGRAALRDAAQWLLNLLAAGIAVTGIVAGWRRLGRTVSTRAR